MEVSGQFHYSAAYPSGNRPQYSLFRRLGLDIVEKRKIVLLLGFEPQPSI
jgi:hypothetical protein